MFSRSGDGQGVALVGVGQGGDAGGQLGGGGLGPVEHGVGQVDGIPFAAHVDLVPGVVAAAGVALGQGAGDVLAAAHGGKQRGEVIADALGAAEGRGGAGDVALDLAGGDPVRQGLVVAVGGLAAAVLDADLQAGGGGVAHGHIARAGVGGINDLGPGSPSHGDQGQERKGCEQNADITKQPLHNSDLLSVTGCQPRTGDPVFCGGKAL